MPGVMFEYLISPREPDQSSYLLAITIGTGRAAVYIKEQTEYREGWIGFFQQIPVVGHIISATIARNARQNVLGAFEASGTTLRPPHETHETHEMKHAQDINKNNGKHFHIHYSFSDTKRETILEELKYLLNKYVKKGFLSDDVTDDILVKYEEFIANTPENNLVTSNHPSYLDYAGQYSQHFMPSIDEHAKCLSLMEYTGCTENNPYSPKRIRNLLQSPQLPSTTLSCDMSADNNIKGRYLRGQRIINAPHAPMPELLTTVVALGVLSLGIYNMFKSPVKSGRKYHDENALQTDLSMNC